MLGTVSRVQASHNPDLGIEGFLLTMYDSRSNLCTDVTMQIRGLFKENTFVTQIPRNISIPESNAKGIPVIAFRPTSSGSLAYLSLAREIIDKDNQSI
jgi:chromosome partitioning protein